MAKTKVNREKALLFDGESLNRFENPFKVLYIFKETNKPTRFKATEATNKELNSFKSTLLNSKALDFRFLSVEYFEQTIKDAAKKWSYSNKRKQESDFVLQIIYRELRDAFISLQSAVSLPFYQRCLQADSNRYVSQSANIPHEKPIIEVQAIQQNGIYKINGVIQISNQWYHLNDFEQYGALLRLNNKWYVCGNNDMQLFAKLNDINQKEYEHDALLF
ncbi:MAG: hypothetical protein LRY27_01435 [Chitinophagales bacterium]|nr:hypothetical protein [Chitinophagales bacterium]